VPLSEHEQRLLDEIEQALYAEDPKFAASVRSARGPSRTRRLAILCILGVVLGLACVLVGLITTLIPLSVAGFVLVVGSCGYAATALRSRSHARSNGTATGSNVRQIRPGGLRSRMEERLRRRFDEN
jgi:hypothetical protein